MADDDIIAFPVAGGSVVKQLASLYNDKTTSDVTFIVGPNATEFYGHTLIIGVVSEVLKAQFSGDWKDNRTVKLEDVEEDAFRALMIYIYTDKVRIQGKYLLDVLELAHRYMISGLLTSLTNRETFNAYYTNHVWKFLTFGDVASHVQLIIRCLEVIDKDPDSFLSMPDFVDVKPSVISLIIDRSTLYINELKLFEHLLKWSETECQKWNPSLQVTSENQRKVMEPFIHQIRFPIMTLEEFADVEKTGILTGSEAKLIKKAISTDKKNITGFDFEPRAAPISDVRCGGQLLKPVRVSVLHNGYSRTLCVPCAIRCWSDYQTSNLREYADTSSILPSCCCNTYRKCKLIVPT